MLGVIKSNRIFLIIVTLLLFASFSINFFGVMPTNSFILNFKDSESLVTNQIVCKGSIFSGQLLNTKNTVTPLDIPKSCDLINLEPYSSQFGLQGRLYSTIYKIGSAVTKSSAISYIIFAQLLTAFISAFTLSLLALWVRKNIGKTASIIVALLLALSPMIVSFASNLYWALPLMFLPLIFALYRYKYSETRKYKIVYGIILGVLLYARFLNGYEYVSTITIMVMSAVGYRLYLEKHKIKVYIKEFSIVLAIALFAFMSAIGTHIYSLNSTTGGTKQSIAIIKNRALARTTDTNTYLKYPYGNLKTMFPDIYQLSDKYLKLENKVNSKSQFWSNVTALINYQLLPVYRTPFQLYEPFATIIYSSIVFSFILVLLFIKRKVWVQKKQLRQVEALFLACFIGFLGYMSWLILARSHSLVHAHINGILLYLSYAVFGFMIIGLYVSYIKKRYFNGHKS